MFPLPNCFALAARLARAGGGVAAGRGEGGLAFAGLWRGEVA
jgi:hypothetical protein